MNINRLPRSAISNILKSTISNPNLLKSSNHISLSLPIYHFNNQPDLNTCPYNYPTDHPDPFLLQNQQHSDDIYSETSSDMLSDEPTNNDDDNSFIDEYSLSED